MSDHLQPTFADGKICYIEIPALDIQQSAAFYEKIFNWRIRDDNTGNVSFDDAAGQVSGMWVTNRAPATTPGLMMSIMVYDIHKTITLITENHGKILRMPGEKQSDKIAIFSDPAGNVFSLYQHRQ